LTARATGAGTVRVFFEPSALTKRCVDEAGKAQAQCAAARGAGLNLPAPA
jgi:hypothetical protein